MGHVRPITTLSFHSQTRHLFPPTPNVPTNQFSQSQQGHQNQQWNLFVKSLFPQSKKRCPFLQSTLLEREKMGWKSKKKGRGRGEQRALWEGKQQQPRTRGKEGREGGKPGLSIGSWVCPCSSLWWWWWSAMAMKRDRRKTNNEGFPIEDFLSLAGLFKIRDTI